MQDDQIFYERLPLSGKCHILKNNSRKAAFKHIHGIQGKWSMKQQFLSNSERKESKSSPRGSDKICESRRLLLQAGIGAAGLFLTHPGVAWSRTEAAARIGESTTGFSELVEMMTLALQHEHGAIVQYANHAGLLSHWIDPIFANTIREIIADEVSHAVFLVNTLIASGVTPSLAVWPPRSGETSRQLVLLDIAAEEGAVEVYSRILEYELSPQMRTQITAIRDAEILHRNIFNDLLEKI